MRGSWPGWLAPVLVVTKSPGPLWSELMGTERSPIRDILAGDDWLKVSADSGMSETEIAKAAAPGGLSAGMFQAIMTVSKSLGEKLGLKSTKREERTFA